MRTQWDLVIIGAGPAGMSAALEASHHGLSVLVLDRQQEPGGQIFRNAGESPPEKRAELGADYARGYALVQSFTAAPVTYLGGAQVWHLTPGRVYFSHQGQSYCVTPEHILIATGGMERPVPVPGWTLPGVMGAGGADVLLKSASLVPKGPVVLCGNGPLILQAAVHLRHFGVPVAGAVLTGDLWHIARAMPKLPAAFLRPAYMMRGMGMGLRMLLGMRCYPNARQLAIAGHKGALTVSFHSMGKKHTLEGAAVLVHEGVVSETRITRLARLNHVWDPRQRYWHVATDIWGATNLPGIRCAGDSAGVRGVDAALALGTLAALDICRELGRLSTPERDAKASKSQKALARFQGMQAFMETVFAPVPENLVPADDAIVCRCEELTARDLTASILEGNYSPDGLKSQARPGMGTCQGRMCSAAVAEMIAHAHNIPLDQLEPYHAQPPLSPFLLGELAAMSLPSEEQ